MIKTLDKLFEELKYILGTNEFACHGIMEGRLNPIYKNDTNDIGLDNWRKFHSGNPIYILENEILEEIYTTNKSVSIDNLDKDDRNAFCFKKFNIKSIYVVPISRERKVVAFIVIPELNQYYEWTADKKQRCEEIIKKYNDEIAHSNLLENCYFRFV